MTTEVSRATQKSVEANHRNVELHKPSRWSFKCYAMPDRTRRQLYIQMACDAVWLILVPLALGPSSLGRCLRRNSNSWTSQRELRCRPWQLVPERLGPYSSRRYVRRRSSWSSPHIRHWPDQWYDGESSSASSLGAVQIPARY